MRKSIKGTERRPCRAVLLHRVLQALRRGKRDKVEISLGGTDDRLQQSALDRKRRLGMFVGLRRALGLGTSFFSKCIEEN